MVSRDLRRDDNRQLTAYPIGSDGIAVIVNSDIPMDNITSGQVVDIFSGKIRNWSEICALNKKITVIAKHEGHGTKKCFDSYFKLQGQITDQAYLFDSNNECIAMVTSDTAAIGYTSIGSAEHAISLNLPLKLLSLNGIKASSHNVANGHYPLRRILNLVTKGKPGDSEQKLIKFMQGPEGRNLVMRHHFISFRPQGIQ